MEIDVDSLRGRRATERRNRASIGDIWERHTWSRPDAVAIIAGPEACESAARQRMTYAQADEAANQVAHGLVDVGLSDGDVAVLVCDNSVEALVTKIGMAKAGVVAAPLNPVLAPEVMAEIIHRVQAKAAVVDAAHLPRVADLLSDAGVDVAYAIAAGGGAADGVPTFGEFIDKQSRTEPDTVIHGDDIWQLLFTSGSTAAPKAAMLSHHNTYYAALAWTSSAALRLEHERDAVFCSYLPIIFHTGDVLGYATWLVGGTLVVGRRPDPLAVARAISEHGVTSLWAGMPQFVRGVAMAFDADPSLSATSLTAVTYGWAPLEEDIYDQLLRVVGHPVGVQSIIGMTEVVVAHRFWLDEHEDLYRRTTPRDNYVGLPNPLLGARIIDADDRTVPSVEGGAGEVVYRSPALTAGYYKDAEATAVAMRGQWFHTGDLFHYGEDGQRLMVDRLKDVVKTGGENVSSIRVEAVLEGHPGVARAAVVGLPHQHWGEAVTAAIIPTPDTSPDTEALIAHCREHLAAYEVPKAIVVVDALPTSVGGKLQKHHVRTLIAERDPYPTENSS